MTSIKKRKSFDSCRSIAIFCSRRLCFTNSTEARKTYFAPAMSFFGLLLRFSDSEGFSSPQVSSFHKTKDVPGLSYLADPPPVRVVSMVTDSGQAGHHARLIKQIAGRMYLDAWYKKHAAPASPSFCTPDEEDDDTDGDVPVGTKPWPWNTKRLRSVHLASKNHHEQFSPHTEDLLTWLQSGVVCPGISAFTPKRDVRKRARKLSNRIVLCGTSKNLLLCPRAPSRAAPSHSTKTSNSQKKMFRRLHAERNSQKCAPVSVHASSSAAIAVSAIPDSPSVGKVMRRQGRALVSKRRSLRRDAIYEQTAANVGLLGKKSGARNWQGFLKSL